MPEETDCTKPASGLWSKKKIALVFLTPPVLMILGILIFLTTFDETLESFPELVAEVKAMPGPETNGFAFLLGRWGRPLDVPYEIRRRWQNFEEGTEPWQDDLPDALNPKRQKFGEELREALALPVWMDPGRMNLGPEQAWIPGSWDEDRLPVLQAEAWRSARAGNLESAISTIAEVRQMARRQIQGSSDAGCVSLGLIWDRRLTEFTCRMVAEFHPADALLARLADIWAADTVSSGDLTEPVRGSCAWFNHQLDDEEEMARIAWPARAFLLKRNKTINLHHREMMKLMSGALRTSATGLSYQYDYFSTKEWRTGPRTVDNLAGLNMVRGSVRLVGWWLSGSGREQLFRCRALRIWLAIRRWQLRHPGQKLESFADLPLEFLASLPLDPWDGQALRWNARDEVIEGLGADWKPGPALFRAWSWFDVDWKTAALRLDMPPAPAAAVKPPPSSPVPP